MNLKTCLLAMAALPLLTGLASASYPCAYTAPVKVKYRYRDRIIERYIPVRDAVSYLATIQQSPTYNTTVNVPAPPPVQQTQFTASFTTAGAGVGQVQQVQAGGGELQLILQEIRGFSDRLAAVEAKCNITPPATPFAVKAPAGVPAALGRCAACHAETNSAASGGGLTFFDKGKYVATARQSAKILKAIADGTMPPPGNAVKAARLTASEVNEVAAWFEKRKAAKK